MYVIHVYLTIFQYNTLFTAYVVILNYMVPTYKCTYINIVIIYIHTHT